jgi:hypothetical protein
MSCGGVDLLVVSSVVTWSKSLCLVGWLVWWPAKPLVGSLHAEVVVLKAFFPDDLAYGVHPCSRVGCSTSRRYGALRARARRQGPSLEVEMDFTSVMSRWKVTKAGSFFDGVLVFAA